MKLPVRLNNEIKEAEIKYLHKSDFDFLAEWRKTAGRDTNPIRRDAVDFALLACKRFTAHSSTELYAQEVDDIADHIRNNPRCEVANLVALQCGWFPAPTILGLIHFRRAWSNNLVLDDLAVQPLI